ncbi:hypothetical protein CLOP_g5564 [Closterium sp. NIES-67]|nr:hypothetical protein CLOP_g5564 [Closterium sp. NIES-67]
MDDDEEEEEEQEEEDEGVDLEEYGVREEVGGYGEGGASVLGKRGRGRGSEGLESTMRRAVGFLEGRGEEVGEGEEDEDVVVVEEAEEEEEEEEDAEEVEERRVWGLKLPHRFHVGTPVEVASNEEGLRGSWFTGTVLQMEARRALVRYDQLLDDAGTYHLEEWWEGVITALSDDAAANMATVEFPGYGEMAQKQLTWQQLRPSMLFDVREREWVMVRAQAVGEGVAVEEEEEEEVEVEEVPPAPMVLVRVRPSTAKAQGPPPFAWQGKGKGEGQGQRQGQGARESARQREGPLVLKPCPRFIIAPGPLQTNTKWDGVE